MGEVTYYVALPFGLDDEGPCAGEAMECPSAASAIRRAEAMSKREGTVGAVAFSRSGDPGVGEFSDAVVLRSFGNVPSNLSAV